MLNVAAYVNRLLNETASNKQLGIKNSNWRRSIQRVFKIKGSFYAAVSYGLRFIRALNLINTTIVKN